jgi:7,8-dihydropterin-6-yl-methyl-4-(beta-D-ribofuranosyl)aminobenzene 5'-phosphate synthase
MDVLEVRLQELHTIALSHGHADHTHGLMGVVERLGERKMPLLLHPDAFLERKLLFPDGHEIYLPPPDRRLLSHEGIEVIEERGPSYLLSNLVLVTGQIPRSTPFERGFPIHYARVADRWQQDPLIHDDQAVVVHVKGKGLVILTGCGHAGAVNTIRHAQQLTGIQDVYAGCSYSPVMRALRSGPLRKVRWVWALAIAAALLTLATGFCLFDDHGTAGHGEGPDLCLGMLAASLAVLSLAPLLAMGWAVNPPLIAAYAVARHTPDPPPRPVLFPPSAVSNGVSGRRSACL